jgi:hypothetical protein
VSVSLFTRLITPIEFSTNNDNYKYSIYLD